ncbi:PH domain-containing protein [Streptomyces javensis]
MERRNGRSARRPARGHAVGQRRWRADARGAGYIALAFAALTTLLDWGSGGLTIPRADLWSLLAIIVFAVLRPPRVTADEGWLTVRGWFRGRRVRTDALVSIGQDGRIATRLVLRDAHGRSVALDPRVLLADPLLWHELETGARRSLARGTLRHGEETLRRLAEHIDGETAHAVLKASGLE